MKFTDLPLHQDIIDALESMHFDECTPIQAQAIPPLIEGHDLLGVAQTGTGKTAAYLLPILHRLMTEPYPEDAINCIIMSPTRELAQQIDRAVDAFSYFLPISSVAIYGGNDGVRFEQERRSLRDGADIIIATPGRLLSHLKMGGDEILGRTSFFILDEADRMLDMGFVDDIRQIVRALPKTRQTLLFSATMPDEIRKLASEMLTNPVNVEIAVSKPADNVQQEVYYCNEATKIPLLTQMFANEDLHRVIVFASSKQHVKSLALAMRQAHLEVSEMHSDLDQKQRDVVMRDFKAGNIDIVVATDIISRGIDIDDIAVVINFDVPRDAEDYVHRIGRTARAGRGGRAITLISPADRQAFARIERLIERKIPRTPLPEGFEAPSEAPADKKSKSRRGARARGGRGERRRGRSRSGEQKPKSEAQPKPATAEAAPADGEKKPARRRRSRRRGGRGQRKAVSGEPTNNTEG